MPKLKLFPALIFLIINTLYQKTFACGYSFIGECSTSIHLRINNTLDSFNIAECSFGNTFDGLDLGNIQSLNLARATAITWESCDNNVASVGLYYRVYEQGEPSGSWSILNLLEDYNTLVGPYTARYRSQFSNNNLVSGLTSGKTYIMEVYFLAQVDTIGDDFIPETTMFQNKGGQNYTLKFKYGGPSAPPFSVVATHIANEKCPGDSTGSVGVTVYGNQSNLFYQWSTVNNNFHTLYELTAGTYTVTVSGVNGYTQSQTMTVEQPDPVSISFQDIQNVVCGDTPGSATAVVSGGTSPYLYLWETGEPDSIATIPLPGAWGLSVTDANGCTGSASVQVGGGTTLEQNLSKVICQGNTYTLDGHIFSAAGNYDVIVEGNGSCDTLFHLTISTLNPDAALTNLPSSADLTCTNPTLTLCAINIPGASYIWKRANVTLSTSTCLTINSSAPYSAFVTLEQSGQSCIASKTILVNSHLVGPLVQVSGVATYNNCSSTEAVVALTASTNAEAPVFVWSLNGSTISTGNSVVIEVADPLNFTPPSILVTDAYGCQGTSGSINIVVNQPPDAPSAESTPTPASGAVVADGSIHLLITGGQGPYTVDWDNGSTGNTLSGLLPGNYCYTVNDAAGCISTGCAEVGFTNATTESFALQTRIYPNPSKAGGTVFFVTPDATAGQMFVLELFTMQGQRVRLEKQPESETNITLQLPENITPGQYFMRIKGERYERFHVLTVL